MLADCSGLCVDLLKVGKLYGSRISYHRNILLKTNGAKNQWQGGESEVKSLIMQGGWQRPRQKA